MTIRDARDQYLTLGPITRVKVAPCIVKQRKVCVCTAVKLPTVIHVLVPKCKYCTLCSVKLGD